MAFRGGASAGARHGSRARPETFRRSSCRDRGQGRIAINNDANASLRQFKSHSRDWRSNLYVYPVISRRSGGLSIGINLNPDMACNFDCIYCQVDRSTPPRTRNVDIELLGEELAQMLALAGSGELFDDPAFADVPAALRRINDIAFSGDGEPTTCKHFPRAVELAARLKRDAGLSGVKIVLITDACYLTRPEVEAALRVMDESNGEIWAKLDAGTEEYYQTVNRPNYSLQHVIDNIIAASRTRPVAIQSMFMRVHRSPPNEAELLAFVDRLDEIKSASGHISHVQVYTVARQPTESFVTPLSREEVDHIVSLVRQRTGLRAEPYYGASG